MGGVFFVFFVQTTTLKRSTGYEIVSFHFLAVGMAGVCVCKPAEDLTQLAQFLCPVKPRFTVCSEIIRPPCLLFLSLSLSFPSHVCSCFLTSTETKEISRGR